MQIAKVLLLDDNQVNIVFFKEIFKKWEMELIVVQDIENSLIRINILKPSIILISSDLKINYENTFSTIFSRNYKVIAYGNTKVHPNIAKFQLFKGFFPLPLDLSKFKNAFFSNVMPNYSQNTLESHIEVIVNEKIGVIELSGDLSWEKTHELKYHLMRSIQLEEIVGVIFIFYEIENTGEDLEETISHLFSFITATSKFKPGFVKFLTMDNQIATILSKDPLFNQIERVQSYAEGFMKIQSATLKKNSIGTEVDFISENMKLVDNVYDDNGNLIKKAGEKFTKSDIDNLKAKGITKIYYPRELSAIGLNVTNIDDVRKNIEELIIKQADSAGIGNEINKKEKKLVVVIEDDANTQKILLQIIQKMGHECKLAKDGVEGLQTVIQFNPNLIILDLMMAKMNGVDFIRKYKDLRKNIMCPILVTSAIARSDVIQSILKMGVTDYILKPLDLSILVEKIKKSLQ